MRAAERPCQKVIDARKKKEQETLKRKAKAGEGPSTTMPKRVRRDPSMPESVVSFDKTVDADPLNHTHPSVAAVQEQTNPEGEENAAGNIAPHLTEEGNTGPDAEGVNEHENSQPTRGNISPIDLASPEGGAATSCLGWLVLILFRLSTQRSLSFYHLMLC